MAKITYSNERTILTFEYQDVIQALSQSIKEYKVPRDSELLAWIVSQSSNGNVDITIEEDENLAREFGHRIIYVLKDLLLEKKGTVFCKSCRIASPAYHIRVHRRSIGDYFNGVDSKTIETIKEDYGLKGPINIGGSGGTRFYCDHDHEIFSVMEWIV
jgi:hypothetical protein